MPTISIDVTPAELSIITNALGFLSATQYSRQYHEAGTTSALCRRLEALAEDGEDGGDDGEDAVPARAFPPPDTDDTKWEVLEHDSETGRTTATVTITVEGLTAGTVTIPVNAEGPVLAKAEGVKWPDQE